MPDARKMTFQLTALDDRRIEVRVDAPGGEARGEAPMPDARLLDEIGAHDPANIPSSLVERTGRSLYKSLIGEAVDEVVVDTLNDSFRDGRPAQVDLRFDPDQVALTRWPWEMLQNASGQFLVRDGLVDLTRYITYPQPPPSFDQSIRGLPLFRVIATPLALPQLAANALDVRPLETLEHATFDGFMHRLLIDRLAMWGLQFDGHGALVLQCFFCDTLNDPAATTCWKCGKPLDEARHVGALAFEKDGEVNWVPAAEFGSVLYNAHVRLAMLLACETAAVGGKLVFSGLAPGLLLAGVPAVIGMQYPVLDSFANSFAREFYASLNRDGDLLAAVRIARRVNMLGAWYSPALYLRRQPAPAERADHAVYLTRNIDTAAPARVRAGLPFLVRLWIRRPETKPLTAARLRAELDIPRDVTVRQGHGEAEIKFEPAVGRRLRRGEVEVTLTSTGADVTPRSMKLFIDESLDAPPAIFTVRPIALGAIPLVFNVIQDGGVIHTVTHRLEVIATDPSRPEVAEHSIEVNLEGAKTPPYGIKLPNIPPGDSGGSALGTQRREILGGEVRVPPPPRQTPTTPLPPVRREDVIRDGKPAAQPTQSNNRTEAFEQPSGQTGKADPGGSLTRAGSGHPMLPLFMEAMNAYSNGDYAQAIALLHRCINGGLNTPDVFEILRRTEAAAEARDAAESDQRVNDGTFTGGQNAPAPPPPPPPAAAPAPAPAEQELIFDDEQDTFYDRLSDRPMPPPPPADEPIFDLDAAPPASPQTTPAWDEQTQPSIPRLREIDDARTASETARPPIARPVPMPAPMPMPAQGSKKSSGFPIWIVIGGLLMLLCLVAVAMVVVTGFLGK